MHAEPSAGAGPGLQRAAEHQHTFTHTHESQPAVSVRGGVAVVNHINVERVLAARYAHLPIAGTASDPEAHALELLDATGFPSRR